MWTWRVKWTNALSALIVVLILNNFEILHRVTWTNPIMKTQFALIDSSFSFFLPSTQILHPSSNHTRHYTTNVMGLSLYESKAQSPKQKMIMIFAERVIVFVLSSCCAQNEKTSLIDIQPHYDLCKVKTVSPCCLETASFTCQKTPITVYSWGDKCTGYVLKKSLLWVELLGELDHNTQT